MSVVSGGCRKAFYVLSVFLLVLAFSHTQYSNALAAPSGDFVEGELIIKLKSKLTGGVIQNMLAQNGLSQLKSIPRLNTILVKTPNGFLLDTIEKILSRNPNIEFVERNYMRYAFFTPNDTNYGVQYHHPKIQSNRAWDIEIGDSSVVIAVVDTGVQSSHPDLNGKVLVGRNFVGTANNTTTNDVYGHGTGVAGTAAAKTNNAVGVAGVCWGCQILPVKVLGDNGSGTLADILEGIAYVADYADANPGKKVILNLSLGGACSSGTSEQNAINDAWNSGVLIVAAAGNNGNSTPLCPASRTNVLAVSATDQNDSLASFSSFGSTLDVSAPGVKIATTWKNSSYAYVNGTSFSSPITSGVAGLIWSLNPNLTNAQVAQLIRDTADDLGVAGFDTSFGHGRVNAFTAVQAAGGASPTPTPTPTSTPIPTPTPNPTPTPTPPTSDTIPPTVVITAPSNGATFAGSSYRTISVSATDNVRVARVDFYIDGILRGSDTLVPYVAYWSPPLGTHTIKAVARDNAGNSASYQITVRRLF